MRFLLLLSVAALAGCTQSPGRYPSLLPRSIESQSLAEPEPPVAAATPDAALDKQIADLRATLDTAAKAFASAAQDAEAKIAVARGLTPGSEPWLDAQVALSQLGRLRQPTVSALSDLEQLATQRGLDGLPPYPALDALIAEAAQASSAQQARIDALDAAMGGT